MLLKISVKKFLIISSSSEFGDFNPKSEGVKKMILSNQIVIMV